MVRFHDHAGCPTDDDLAAYVQGWMASTELSAIEAHVSRCSPCRHLLSGLARATRSQWSTIDSQAPTLRQIAWNSSGDLPAGARIGRYIVVEWRGCGGMGVVYAAYDPELDRKIALKVLRDDGPSTAARPPIRDLLRREAQAMARLNHPHVVSVFDVGNVNDFTFIAMELIEGETLCQWLATEPRSRDQIIACFTAAGSGLAAAHAAGLVHRDFKPDNVLIGNDGRVCVTDFGLARRAPGEPQDAADSAIAEPGAAEISTGVAGTLAYMAPEQYLRRRTDARADQFSFAVALYKALYGELPFSRSRFSKLDRRASAVRDAPRGSTVPIALRQVLLRALSTDPAARYPAMTDLLAALAPGATDMARP
jgi:serine/threonine protein kinase